MLLGVAVKLPTAAAGVTALTVTVVETGPLDPPAPEQVKIYVYVPGMSSGPIVSPASAVDTLPCQASLPDPPLAVHTDAPADVQPKLNVCPALILPGVAVRFVIDAGGVAAPTAIAKVVGPLGAPVPVQSSVNV